MRGESQALPSAQTPDRAFFSAIQARRSTAKNSNYACAWIKTPGHLGRSDE